MEFVKEIHLRTTEFEKVFTALQQLSVPLKLGEKMRVMIDYDPQKQTTEFKYFAFKEPGKTDSALDEMFIFCTEIDKRTGNIMLSPPRGEKSIIIKCKDDVKVLTDYLMDCFQR